MNLLGSTEVKITQNKITINMIQGFCTNLFKINPLESYDFTSKNHIFKDI